MSNQDKPRKKEKEKESKTKVDRSEGIIVEVTHHGAHHEGGAHKVGEKLTIKDGIIPGYLKNKCMILANGKA